ncbi:hypothetical protein BDF19DRAFT_490768 [Syncephalis fuscata]|nr:hypothetical protein BDF19DRAFT_490768 [Syncephalis fuscata]
MPECWFFMLYLHVDPEKRRVECPWYARGFCKHGPHCRNKHVRRVICQLYINGFCPLGPDCPNGHPKYELPVVTGYSGDRGGSIHDRMRNEAGGEGGDPIIGGGGPPLANGPPPTNHRMPQHMEKDRNSNQQPRDGRYRPISEVQCYKCGQMGHYANRCPG